MESEVERLRDRNEPLVARPKSRLRCQSGCGQKMCVDVAYFFPALEPKWRLGPTE